MMLISDKTERAQPLKLSGLITSLSATSVRVIVTVIGAGIVTQTAHAVPMISQTAAHLVSQVNQLASSSFVYPLMGPRTSSNYGTRRHPIRKRVQQHHDGIDLAAPIGSTIRSIASGYVIYADPLGGYGKLVVIRHDTGLTSHYGHCNQLGVKIGQRVNAGDVIATVGSTGLSTGPHLHFEIRRNGEPEHPERYLPGLAEAAEG
jgi:murein DD-endopeptidase MepM/ murein hydrolase activator NlpD